MSRNDPPAPSRPSFTPGYGIDRSAVKGMLPWSFVVERMAASRNYWIATATPEGPPHVAPVWGLWLDDAFYFSTDPKSRKGRNLAASPEVVVHLESGDEVVILEGTAERITDRETLTHFADAYEAKFEFRPDPSEADQGVYRLDIKTAFAWTEQDFPNNSTRWSFGS
jgi:nitroimidazol reductase NimA-like FMN-containing flavoprotein (pyridoxamine 5'-phosphate oxidase superfamily)